MALSKIDGTNLIAPTIPVASGGTGSATLAGAGLVNTPNFSVKSNGAKTISTATWTKLSFGTEVFDSDSAFASDKFTVPSGKAGKYFFYSSWQTSLATDFNEQRIAIYKNGTAVDPTIQGFHDHYGSIQISKLLDLSASDYIEVYAYQNTGSNLDTLNTEIFQGYKLIE